MKSIIVGTAGHIDHGKTTLVRALTGIDTDRLEEEKRRGISIDLGFAHLQLTESLRAAFIDVPGHERFIRNMLAGVGGIDLVMLVVAADESIRPQTREHFDICRLLRIRSGFVALTRTDLADPDIVELVRMEVQDFVRGSFLEGSPIIPVSAVTGSGLADIRKALTQAGALEPQRSATQSFRMPVDRAFVMPGFGSVATGTVVGGTVQTEQEIELLPEGRRARVRGLQVHGVSARKAAAGQRAAVNLAGIEVSQIPRGTVLGQLGSFRPTLSAECLIELLPGVKPLKDRTPVHFHAGTSEVVAELRVLDGSGKVGSGKLAPGAPVPARVIFRKALVLLPGDRFIIRMFSPVITIGGGEIVDPFPPQKLRMADSLRRVRALSSATLASRIDFLVSENSDGLSVAELAIRTGEPDRNLLAALPSGVASIPGPQPWIVSKVKAAETVSAWRERLTQFHLDHPLVPGVPREDFRSRYFPEAPVFVFDYLLTLEPAIRSTAEFLHLATHRLALKEDEERALASIETAFAEAGLSVPGVEAVLASSGVDRTRARNLLQVLLRQKRLLRVSDDLVFHPAALQSLRDLLQEKTGVRFAVGDFKDWTGVSRKYAIPLLEYFDRERVTRREGESRVVLVHSK